MTLGQKWNELSKKNEAGLIAYVMAGFPSVSGSMRMAKTLAQNGADMIEIGLPFSDPIADGPVIQSASNAGLRNGASLDRVLNEVEDLNLGIPLILMSYLNPLLGRGRTKLFDAVGKAGISGLIIPDLPADESDGWASISREHGVDLILLAAPTSSVDRLRMIAGASNGFVYCVGVTGTTGVRKDVPPDAGRMVRTLRRITDKPLAVGFGISTPGHVRALSATADGVIVASRLLRAVEKREDLPALVRSLKRATVRSSRSRPSGRPERHRA
jgi:tryptophan synthase alpha chain